MGEQHIPRLQRASALLDGWMVFLVLDGFWRVV